MKPYTQLESNFINSLNAEQQQTLGEISLYSMGKPSDIAVFSMMQVMQALREHRYLRSNNSETPAFQQLIKKVYENYTETGHVLPLAEADAQAAPASLGR